MTEDQARTRTICPSCGGDKAIGTVVCWTKCWSSYKHFTGTLEQFIEAVQGI